MKTIKVIDLLNKIANEEEMSKYIKYDNTTWEYIKETSDYRDTGSTRLYFFSDFIVYNANWLNDEVEIIEEQQDIDIQEIKVLPEYKDVDSYDTNSIRYNRYSINKLIQAVKQLDRKIKEKEK